MEGIVSEVVIAVLQQYGALGFFVCLSMYLLYNAFRRKPNGNGDGMTYARKADLDDHKKKTDEHLVVVEGRIADNYEEFLKFQTEVAKELATKEDLDATEQRIKDHISFALHK